MIMELQPGTDLWLILPDGSNLHVDCTGDAVIAEQWTAGEMIASFPLEIHDNEP